MKGFAIFFSIVLLVHSALNYYIFIRGWQALPLDSALKPWYIVAAVILWASYILGQVLESKAPSIFSDALVWIGSFWFAFMVYFFFTLVLFDLVRLIDHWVPIFPASWRANWPATKLWTMILTVVFYIIVIGIGFLNARTVRIKPVTLEIDKRNAEHDSLTVVALSDMHLGTIIGRARLTDMVEKINSCNPDIVLMGGDQIDGNPDPAIKMDLGSLFKSIKSKYGVYAINGNHEFIGNVEKSDRYMEEHDIHLLRDAVTPVAGLYIVGREDLSINRQNRQRATLDSLMHGIGKEYPVIMMDHQPFHLEEAEKNGVDLQFSGHTHHAQIWPLSYITKMVYEVSWGYKKKTNTHIYVSCGAGTWGPPVRLGNTPEIMKFTLKFKNH